MVPMPGKMQEYFEKLDAAREADTRRERHGLGELVLRGGVPSEANGCFSHDGALTRSKELEDHERVWSRPVTPGLPFQRRGRLRVDLGAGLYFVDEPEADAMRQAAASRPVPDLERDMLGCSRMRQLACDSDLFAGLLYATGQAWSQSWRSNGGTVASMRGGESYLDWYCWGREDTADEQVVAELRRLGWELVLPEPKDQDLKTLVGAITDENRHGTIEMGPAVGQETLMEDPEIQPDGEVRRARIHDASQAVGRRVSGSAEAQAFYDGWGTPNADAG